MGKFGENFLEIFPQVGTTGPLAKKTLVKILKIKHALLMYIAPFICILQYAYVILLYKNFTKCKKIFGLIFVLYMYKRDCTKNARYKILTCVFVICILYYLRISNIEHKRFCSSIDPILQWDKPGTDAQPVHACF